MPLVAVNHLQAHIYACRMAAGRDVFPCVGLIVSGGHTSLYRCRDAAGFRAAGRHDRRRGRRGVRQSGQPAGPAVSRRAGDRAGRRATAIREPIALPRPLVGRRPARLQLQRAEDGRALSHLPARASRLPTNRCRCRRASGRSGRQLSGGRGRLPGGQGVAGARAERA